jgi:hypothetical protein
VDGNFSSSVSVWVTNDIDNPFLVASTEQWFETINFIQKNGNGNNYNIEIYSLHRIVIF